MQTVIKENKYKFVNLFMDHGIHMNWTRTTINKLVKETVLLQFSKFFL